MQQKVAVLGAGSWGSALAKCVCENGHHVVLWGKNETDVQTINNEHHNNRFLKHVALPVQLKATVNLKEALENVDVVVFVVPTNAMREVAKKVNEYLTSQPYIVHAGKGLEQTTNLRISEILAQELTPNQYKDIIVLSGPSHAEEVAKCDLTSITAACQNEESAAAIQQLFMNHYFRVYTNTDVVGVELGAALKNIIAVGAGILRGLNYGDNAIAALVTRGLVEMTRFGTCFGSKPETFSGLSGVGDLIVTCTSYHSRNWQCGFLLGQGYTIDEALKKIDMAVEGVWTTKVVYDIAKQKKIDMPITTAIYNVIYNQMNPKEAILHIMARVGKSEQVNEENCLL